MYSSTAYAPFGESQASQTSGAADASFTGQDQDTVASLYDFTFRRDSPSQGRWISPDPLGAGAVDIGNPQTWNRYAYVGNGPTGAIDAWGLKSMPCISSPVSCMMGGGGGDCTVNNPDGTQTTTTLDGLDASCGQINSAVQIGATQGGSINSAGQSVAIGVSSNGQGGLSVWIDGGCVSYQDGFGNSDASCVPGAYVTLLDLAASAAANNGFTLGIRAPGQTWSQCMAANANTYSIGGATELTVNVATGTSSNISQTTSIVTGNGITGLIFEGPGAGDFLNAAGNGAGSALTYGRRTSDIMSLNLAGSGGLPQALGSTGAQGFFETAGQWLNLGLDEAEKFGVDAGLAGAEAINCAIQR